MGELKVMKNKRVFLFQTMLTIIQFLSIICVIVLEYYSSEKMGVARYLVYKKQVFETTLFTPEMLNIDTYIFLAGAIICLILLMVKAKGSGLGKFISLSVATFANIMGIIFLRIGTQLYAYHFFILGIMAVIVIQYIKLIVIFYRKISK